MHHRKCRNGLTLLEVVLAMVILTVVTLAVAGFVRQPSERVQSSACNLRVRQLNVHIKQYRSDYQTLPSVDLRELADGRYLGEVLPVCPVDGRGYSLDRRVGAVVDHNHP